MKKILKTIINFLNNPVVNPRGEEDPNGISGWG